MSMFSITNSPLRIYLFTNPISSKLLCPSIPFFPSVKRTPLCRRVSALETGPNGSNPLRKPVVPPARDFSGIAGDYEGIKRNLTDDDGGDGDEEEVGVDWEDQILEDTVPLVGFVKFILHSGKYESGDKLNPEHERTILERLLPYHPEFEKKIGCGIEYITVGYHPDFERSRCFFIVRKDGELIDFSYWKCIKGLIRKNYPLYADSFILRHFRQRRQSL